MLIPLNEPSNSRYIHINPATNRVHLLVPFIAGIDISTDNTCKAAVELKAFFEGGAFNELESYKNTLKFHIALLEEGPLRSAKEARLDQINMYLEAVISMRNNYKDVVDDFLTRPSNLYSIQLRPRSQDPYSRVVNPVFSINRGNDYLGTPLSPLYNRMHALFADVVIGAIDPKSRLTQAVLGALSSLPRSPTFEDIQKLLHERCQALFGIAVDFDHYFKHIDNNVEQISVTKASIDAELIFGEDTSPEEYIDGLLNLCAENLWIEIHTSPFYKVSNIAEDLPAIQRKEAIAERTERLSILTQFFLANVNVYCRAKGISTANFGVVLDNLSKLSDELTGIVRTALSTGVDVEDRISQFFNAHTVEFGLTRYLNSEDITAIKQKFANTYQTVTVTKENPHMDDFMFLDTEAHGRKDIFITSKGLICTDFSNIAPATPVNQYYFDFAEIRREARTYRDIVTSQDEPLITVDIEPEALMDKLGDVHWEGLPKEVVDACSALPAFKVRKLLDDVAKGKQDEAHAILQSSDDTQMLLRTPGKFTDYSRRTFNCTAYEYAYWAKDTHMQRMLERHMDDETKAFLLEKIDEIERSGLAYQQDGVSFQNPHYDMSFVLKNLSPDEFRQLKTIAGQYSPKIKQATADNYQKIPFTATEYESLKEVLEQHMPTGFFSFFYISPAKAIGDKLQFDFYSLITALENFVNNYAKCQTYHERAMAWLLVGIAQRNVPAHVANEYCRTDRPFDPCPEFNEETLPRVPIYSDYMRNVVPTSWFPLTSSSSGLGFDFAFLRRGGKWVRAYIFGSPQADALWGVSGDLTAVRHLDEVRTVDLTQSRENLSQPANQVGHECLL